MTSAPIFAPISAPVSDTPPVPAPAEPVAATPAELPVTGLTGTVETPLGPMLVVVDGTGAVTELWFTAGAWPAHRLLGRPGYRRCDAATAEAGRQITDWFAGRRRDFDLPLNPAGTAFQRQVWDELLRIPFGATRSYGQLAAQLGRPGAARAVGRANATNPIALIVPCHRVIGSAGGLTGYAGGLPLKQALLDFEAGRRPLPGLV